MPAVTVYDPHPGIGGPIVPLPESIRLAAESMSGQRLELSEVVERLEAAVTEGAVEVHENFIMYGCGVRHNLPIGGGRLAWEHNWRVVRIER